MPETNARQSLADVSESIREGHERSQRRMDEAAARPGLVFSAMIAIVFAVMMWK